MQRWRDVTEREFPDRVHLLPKPDDITLDKLEDGAVMTDTCNTALKTNRLLGKEVNGTVHELYCHNHLRNVHVKNVLLSLTDFLRAHLHDSIDEIAPELRVQPNFATLARAFDKEFSLCANYCKGHGELFRQWMHDNHPGELLLHVERAASGGRQDVCSMAALAMFWNRNYCLEFLEEQQRQCGKEDNILMSNLMCLLSSVEMIAVSRLWSILHFAIVMPLRWLAGKTHTLAEYKWGPISMGRVYDQLKIDLKSIVDQPELVHDEDFMMGMMQPWQDELPPFAEYIHHQFECKQTRLVADSNSIAVPYKLLKDEVFSPKDQDNKDSTTMLEKLAPLMAQAWIDELMDTSKATYMYMSDCDGKYSWKCCPEDVKTALLGMMAVNDLAESSFAGVTSQIQAFGRINLHGAAAVSDMGRNGFMDHSTKKGDKLGLFHDLPDELQITAIMCAMEFAPATQESNCHELERRRLAKQKKDAILKEEGMEKATDEYIECLIHHRMASSERCWKTVAEVRKGVNALTYKNEKETALKDNIQIRFKGYGWAECYTAWSKDGKKKSVPQLQARLIEIINSTKGKQIPQKPPSRVPQRKNTAVVGTLCAKMKDLDRKAMEETTEFDMNARRTWMKQDEQGIGSVIVDMQQAGRVTLDNYFIGVRIEYL